jgi:hexosaminidase
MGLLRKIVLAFVLLLLPGAALAAHPALIPLPVSVEWHSGALPITAATVVQGDGAAAPTAAFLAQSLGLKTGARGKIQLRLIPASQLPNPEGYRLRVTSKQALVEASDPRGLFYGAETLRQLITETKGRRAIAGATIADAPRFAWRGLLIDVSRHCFG